MLLLNAILENEIRESKKSNYWFNSETRRYDKPTRQQQSSLILDPAGIQLFINKHSDQYQASVYLHYIDIVSNKISNYKRIIKGIHTDVLQEALKIIKQKNIQKEFLKNWDKKLYSLFSKYSAYVSSGNIYHSTPTPPAIIEYGPFNIVSSGELLKKKITESDEVENVEQLAAKTGINAATIYRQIDGSDIGREQALKYAQVLKCDPVDLLFNPIYINVWGKAHNTTYYYTENNKYSLLPGEIVADAYPENVLCPREIYRPNIKAIELIAENKFAFYYHTSEKLGKDGDLAVVGVDLLSEKNEPYTKYYFGYVYFNKDNTVDVKNFNPKILELQKEDFKNKKTLTIEQVFDAQDTFSTVDKNIPAKFVAPVITLIDKNQNYLNRNFNNINMITSLEKMKDEKKRLEAKERFFQIINDAAAKDKKRAAEFEKKADELQKKIDKIYKELQTEIKQAPTEQAEYLKTQYLKAQSNLNWMKKDSWRSQDLLTQVREEIDARKAIEKVFEKGENNISLYEIDQLVQKFSINDPYLRAKLKNTKFDFIIDDQIFEIKTESKKRA